ncbi:MAG: hypothetical protein GXP54_06640 [Deltaproteobacteria bacterium]|nr:hypothetical protein [Deltaproteobacteria bacterium]
MSGRIGVDVERDPQSAFSGEEPGELRARCVMVAGLFLAVHAAYTIFQLVGLVTVNLPPVVDTDVLWKSFALNAAVDLATIGFILLNVLNPRFYRVGVGRIRAAVVALAGIMLVNWGIQLHYGGSMSSQVMPLILGTIVVVAWLLPWKTTLFMLFGSTLYVLVIVTLEMTGYLRYSPIIRHGPEMDALFQDWRVVTMNALIYACTFGLVMLIMYRMRRELARSRAAMESHVRRLEHEIREREKAQKTLRGAVDRLTRLNNDLSQTTRGVAHDLRNPLHAIGGFTSLLKENLDATADEEVIHCAARIEEGIEHMRLLLEDLSDLTRTEPAGTAPQSCDCEAVLKSVIDLFEHRISELGAKVALGSLPSVTAHEIRLAQLFQNLLDNALKFHSDAPPRIEVSAQPLGDSYVFMFKDNGIGMDPDSADRIFDPFERLDTARDIPGSGIGLATCRKVVEDMGGRIWVEPNPEGGSTFYFTLPTVPAGKNSPQTNDSDNPPKAVELPIDGVLDLHAFAPRDVADVVATYLDECGKRGITAVRIIHGKGIGVQRRIVEGVLKRHPDVVSYRGAREGEGGWGATVVELRQ